MKMILKAAAIATALIPVAASAQVAGIATADQTIAVVKSKALGAAYQQIGTAFASNGDLMRTNMKDLNELRKQLDTNKDNQLDQAEMDAAVKAKSPVMQQIDAKEAYLVQLQEPIVKAQVFAIESILMKYGAAQSQVVAAKKINMILAPDAFLWAPDTIDVTPALTAAIDLVLPVVPSITPPAGWQPSRQAYAMQQQIEQLLRSQQQANQQQAPAPAAGAAPAPARPSTDGR
jgi:Skp family chaperone for outer membrane proteins